MIKFTFLLLILFPTTIFAQDRNCTVMEDLENRKVKELKAQTLTNKIEGDIITIPVVVHILYRKY